MEETGLDWKSKKRVGKYSIGMKQRLGIAQAIMEDPKILLLASHIKEDLEVLCDEVYEIQACRLHRVVFGRINTGVRTASDHPGSGLFLSFSDQYRSY